MKELLRVEKLRKRFGTETVLEGITLTVPQGKVTTLVGPSGAGKTTLLRCLNFLERAEEGSVTFEDETYDLKRVTRQQIRAYRMRTGFVFQNFNLFLNKTAIDNVTEGLIVARRMSREEARRTGEEALERVGLLDHATYYPAQLSGGQQQRVAIARALATKPKIIFFDEPTSALDPELTDEVLSVMRDLARDGMTMLLVTHEIAFARSISSQMVFMEEGRIVEAGETERVFTTPQMERTAAFLKTGTNE